MHLGYFYASRFGFALKYHIIKMRFDIFPCCYCCRFYIVAVSFRLGFLCCCSHTLRHRLSSFYHTFTTFSLLFCLQMIHHSLTGWLAGLLYCHFNNQTFTNTWAKKWLAQNQKKRTNEKNNNQIFYACYLWWAASWCRQFDWLIFNQYSFGMILFKH